MQPSPKWMRWCCFVLFAVLPWSFECSFGAWKLNVPSEPLIAIAGVGLAGLVWQNPGIARAAFSNNFLLQISAVWIAWLAVSACFSTMPVVSRKYWVVEAGHWWVFAVGMAMFPDLWRRAFSVFAVSMAGVVVCTLIHHSFYHFRADQSLLAPMPFFPENTVYAAVLGMVVAGFFVPSPRSTPPPTPPLKGRGVRHTLSLPSLLGEGSGVGLNGGRAWLILFLFIGLFFSFCRAAWLSVLFAGGVFCFFYFREKWRSFAFAGALVFLSLFLFRGQMLNSMTNVVAKDVSMLERLNRYACALRMAHDRPWTGFGPGTFQFQYIPYQRSEEMTRISAKELVLERSPSTYGRGGGAHSEFFQAIAENGWPGLALWLALAAAVFWAGFNTFFREKTKERQWFALALTLSLLTFFLHGIFNNMLHDGRVAALVWGQIAILSLKFEKFGV